MVALMARTTRWERTIDEYEGAILKANDHFVLLASIAEGETVGRVRFNWQALHPSTTAADGTGFVIASGISVVPAGTLTSALDQPFTEPGSDWLWWEAGILQPIYVADVANGDQEIDVFPVGDCIRDARAQRQADVGGSDVWFMTQTSTLSPGQCDHYLSIGASVLVIEAA